MIRWFIEFSISLFIMFIAIFLPWKFNFLGWADQVGFCNEGAKMVTISVIIVMVFLIGLLFVCILLGEAYGSFMQTRISPQGRE